MTGDSPAARPGRWRSGAESRKRILDAARALFEQHGYDGTTVRAVAAAAAVDPAMVFYFFDNKPGLFAASVTMLSTDLPPAIETMFAGTVDGLGERMVRTLVENMDGSDRTPLAMLARSAPTHDRSEALLREYIDREIIGRLTALLDTPDAALRGGMVSVQLLGLTVARYLVRIEPIASATVDQLVDRFGPLVQHCLTGPAAP